VNEAAAQGDGRITQAVNAEKGLASDCR